MSQEDWRCVLCKKIETGGIGVYPLIKGGPRAGEKVFVCWECEAQALQDKLDADPSLLFKPKAGS